MTAKKTAGSINSGNDSHSQWVSSDPRMSGSGIESEETAPSAFTLEISLKYLHNRWSEFSCLDKKALEDMSKIIKLIQNSDWNNLMRELREFKVKKYGRNKVSRHGKLKLLYPKAKEIGDFVYCRLDDKARIYFAKGKDPNLYMIAIDPEHQICRRS